MTDSLLPTFIVIGAAKCGTTTICNYLAKHPEIFITTPKEPAFFSNNEIYNRGIDWYKSLFKDGSNYKVRGEGSVNYTKLLRYPETAQRIANHIPDVKLIYITRDPLDQIMSSWRYKYLTHHEKSDFADAIRNNAYYFDDCNYSLQINEYKKYFSNDKILVLFLEDLSSDPDTVMTSILSFIGVSTNTQIDTREHSNASLGRSRESIIVQLLRKSPAMFYLRKLTSKSLRAFISNWLRRGNKTLNSGPTWDKATLDYAMERIEPKTRDFLTEHGKAADFWLSKKHITPDKK